MKVTGPGQSAATCSDLDLAAAAGGLAMYFDPIAIADALAQIASATKDPETARQLIELIDRLLTEAGLPPEGPNGRS